MDEIDGSNGIVSSESAARLLSIEYVMTNICFYLDPRGLLSLALVNKGWNAAVVRAWEQLESCVLIKYLCFQKRFDMPRKVHIQKVWPYEHQFEAQLTWEQPRGILIFGGIFGTARRICRQMYYIDEALPERFSKSNKMFEMRAAISTQIFPKLIGAMAHCQDAFGTNLFFGGWDSSVNLVNEIGLESGNALFYDKVTGTVRESAVSNPAVTCYSAAARSVDGHLLVLGGATMPYRGASVERTVYTLKFGQTTAIPETNQADGYADDEDLMCEDGVETAYGRTEAVVANDHDDDDTVWTEYSESEISDWLILPPMLTRRCGHSAVTCFDDSVVTFGGYGGGAEYLNSAERFDPVRECWLALPSMATVRSGASAVLGPNGGCYVAGGSIDGTIGLSAVEMLDVREGVWHALPSLLKPRGYVAGCIGRGEQWYISGGLHRGSMAASVEVMDMRMNLWRTLEMEANPTWAKENLSRACHQMILT